MKIETKEDFERALKDEDWQVRVEAVRSEYFEAKYMDKALSDKFWYVRLTAVESRHFGTEHMDIALSDEHWDVRLIAKLSITHTIIKNLDDYYGDFAWKYSV